MICLLKCVRVFFFSLPELCLRDSWAAKRGAPLSFETEKVRSYYGLPVFPFSRFEILEAEISSGSSFVLPLMVLHRCCVIFYKLKAGPRHSKKIQATAIVRGLGLIPHRLHGVLQLTSGCPSSLFPFKFKFYFQFFS